MKKPNKYRYNKFFKNFFTAKTANHTGFKPYFYNESNVWYNLINIFSNEAYP